MRKLGPALVLTGALTLTACGSAQKHDTVPAREVIAAATSTQSTRSERMHQDVVTKAQGQTSHITADGSFDNQRQMGTSTMDLSQLTKAAGGNPADSRGEFRIVKPTLIYMRIPLFKKQVHKPWVKVDLLALGRQQGIDFSSLTSGGTGDPTQSLDQLRAASGPVEVIGSDTVRGVHTSHYRATIDLRRTPALVPASKRAAAKRSIDQITKLGASPKVKTDIWISPADKRVHRLETNYSYKVNGQKIEMDQTIDLFDFGVKVPPVQTPPPDQVADLAELAKQKRAATP